MNRPRPELAWRPAKGWFLACLRLIGWNLPAAFSFSWPSRLAAGLMLLGSTLPVGLIYSYLGLGTPVWVSDGVVLAILLRTPPRSWPGLTLILFVGELVASMLGGQRFRESFVGTLCDLTDVIPAAFALHFAERAAPLFSSTSQISRFALVNLLAPILGALAGGFLLFLDGFEFVMSFAIWYLSVVFAQLIVLPFLLMWVDSVATDTLPARLRWEVALPAALVGLTGIADFSARGLPGSFLSFPFLLLAAFRGGILGAATAAAVLTLVSSTFTLLGAGPIAAVPDSSVTEHLLILQLYLGVILLSSLPVAVMLEQRKLVSAANTLNELTHMARHDVLTGLPNRLLFEERLNLTRAGPDAENMQTALLMLDLDRFKPVNDLHGHAAGDRLLQMVADRIRANLRSADSVARLGGDEFAVISQVENAEISQILAQRIITALTQPFDLDGLIIEIGCSIGVALSPAAGLDNDSLMQRADAALYRAKAEGRNCCRFFEAGMEIETRERAQLETELRHAIADDQLVPHFQPIVQLGCGSLVGFEMLARWPHPTLGEISPTVFVPIAETASLIGRLTEQLLRRACSAALAWPDNLFVAVNVSSIQLRDRRLPGLFRSILTETGLPPYRLQVELTESALIQDFALARIILMELKETGIKLALDDFGTGYSSLVHLQALPLDKLKIDMSFVRSMTSMAESRTIVAGVIGLSHSLGLKVVAEGVEDRGTAEALQMMGCDFAQGWLYGRAMPAAAVDSVLQAGNGKDPLEVTLEGVERAGDPAPLLS